VSGSGISWAICKSAPRSRQITSPAPHRSVFYRPDALPAAQPTASKHWRYWFTAIRNTNLLQPATRLLKFQPKRYINLTFIIIISIQLNTLFFRFSEQTFNRCCNTPQLLANKLQFNRCISSLENKFKRYYTGFQHNSTTVSILAMLLQYDENNY